MEKETECHCGKDGHALRSINCKVHGGLVKAWAVTLRDELFIPDFSVKGKFENVMQIHSYKKDAVALVRELGKEWKVTKVSIMRWN
jgi:hypothetical protein